MAKEAEREEFERALYALEQALFRNLECGLYRYHDIECILGEIRKLWNAQRSSAGQNAVLARVQDPDKFIESWRGVAAS